MTCSDLNDALVDYVDGRLDAAGPDPRRGARGDGDEIGLVVLSVAKGGPADLAGIRYGDTLLHLGDDTVKTLEDLYGFLRADHVGETVAAKVWRAGKVETFNVTLAAKP